MRFQEMKSRGKCLEGLIPLVPNGFTNKRFRSIVFIPKLKTRQTMLAGWKVLILVLLL